MSLSRNTQGNIAAAAVPDTQLAFGGQNWAELVFQVVPQSLQPVPVHVIQSPDCQFFTPYKLPVSLKAFALGIVVACIFIASDTRI